MPGNGWLIMKQWISKAVLAMTAVTLCAAGQSALAQATSAGSGQAWPAKQPIKWVAVFPPGGSVDQVARILAVPLSQQLGQNIIVENKGGASGSIGTSAMVLATFSASEYKTFAERAVGGRKRFCRLRRARLVGHPGAGQDTARGTQTHERGSQQGNEEVNKALKNPEIAKKLSAQGIEIVGGSSESALMFIDKQIDTWAKVVKDNGIKAD